ncbi:hypothetical protein ZOSMA_223G00130 [Zostera marina]|uniref:Uncharacterized protein n=1 Tax=Zostera marina TaxID=29655 RepID=A0A0K9PJ76_ZOSMR|nr:hypothetical protein ZOSMA_223G00130 [Zostera marina]
MLPLVYQQLLPPVTFPGGTRGGTRWGIRGRSALLSFPCCCSTTVDTPSRTQRILENISTSTANEVGGAGGAYSYSALKRLDQLWSTLCDTTSPVKKEPKDVVLSYPGSSSSQEFPPSGVKCEFEVLVCGGTLGIFLATALASKGVRVGIVERNLLKGRDQEWNISRKELMELVHAGVITEEDIEHATVSEFNPNRCGFEEKGDVWVKNILNLGISPAVLIEKMKQRFSSFGGVIYEENGLSSIRIYDDAAILELSDGSILSSQLVIDAMGNFSPVVKQIRLGKKPDGVCLVVGSCARGFEENSTSDVIYSSMNTRKVGDSELQYFWEAFPAGSGSADRTIYMFTYIDPQPGSPRLEDLLEEFWELMPNYQNVKSIDQLEILRVIYGIFPTYRDSPLPASFDRIIQVGDASGIQSPVSFGGFGSMTRHLIRLSDGIYEAVSGNFLDSSSLSLLNPYMPNLSSSWMFQKAMSANSRTGVSPGFINELLYANFSSMEKLGNSVLGPFLQDVIQFWPLVKTLSTVMITRPQILPSIFQQVGISVIFDWLIHFVMLGNYTFLSTFADPIIRPLVESLPKKQKYEWRRHLEAWKYGAGLDYKQ